MPGRVCARRSARAAICARHPEAGPARSADAANGRRQGHSGISGGGSKGTWNAIDNRIAIPEKPEEFGDRDSAANFPTGPAAFPKPKMSQVPFQPWARSLFLFRTTHEFEPYTRCKPAGGARMVATVYGTDFIEVLEQKRIYITQTGGPHSFRPDLHGWPSSSQGPRSQLLRTLRWSLGGGYPGHRHGRVQRTILDRPSRHADDRTTSPHRTHHAAGFQYAALRNDDRRSRRLYSAVDDRHVLPLVGPEQNSSSSSARTAILLPILMIGGRT